jgi:recombination protein RecA
VYLGTADRPGEGVIPFGITELDRALPDGGIVRGGVVELSVSGDSSLSTSLSLSLIRSFQKEGRASAAARTPWCAFVDPSMSLYAPGVAALGIELERLLVVRPSSEAVGRVAIKLAESSVFSLVVVDTVGALGARVALSLKCFVRVIRRLSMAVDGTKHSVLLLTSSSEPRSLPLPVAQRLELFRPQRDRLLVRVAKDRRGRVTPARSVAWRHGQGGSGAAPAALPFRGFDERQLA